MLRSAQGLTQAVLADHAELSQEYIGKLERGEKAVTVKTLARILRVLGTTLGEFFKGM
jgi:transcriptional regulator with XRE-family HTH domain